MAKGSNADRIAGNFKGKDILALSQFDKESITVLFTHTRHMADLTKNAKVSDLLKGNIITLLFYEPSSRTFGSFSSSIKRLGGQTIAIHDAKNVSSVAKGETLEDTIRTFQAYSDAIIIRHPEKGSAEKAAVVADVPVINAGDGTNEHPTQALMDLFTIYETFGSLDDVTIVFAGDMLNSRTVHSVLFGLSHFKNITAYLLSPESLRLSAEHKTLFIDKGVRLYEIEKETDIPNNADVWYWTRVQKERFSDMEEYERVKHRYILSNDLLAKKGNDHLILMHPLPRTGEILEEVDSDKRAVYFKSQIKNGVKVRMALMGLVLGKL